jgi:hypothetical protein
VGPVEQADETLRSRSHQIWCLLVATFCLVFVVGGIVVAIGTSHPGQQIALAIVFAVLTAAAIRWAFASVVVTDDALIVRNPLRVRVIPWADLAHFETRDAWLNRSGAFPRPLIVAKRRDGSKITCIAVCPMGERLSGRMLGQVETACRQRRGATH